MSYASSCRAKRIDVFACTRRIEKLGDLVRRVGESYAETKDAAPALMKEHIERDITQGILDRELPNFKFRVSIERAEPIPIFRITVITIDDDSAIGQSGRAKRVRHIRNKLMQILWKRNADVVSFSGIYSRTHFAYQIVFARPPKKFRLTAIDLDQEEIVNMEGKQKLIVLYKQFKREFQDLLGDLSVEELSQNALLLPYIVKIQRLLTQELNKKRG